MPITTQFNLMSSQRWNSFLESAARSLWVNLVMISEDTLQSQVHLPNICPACSREFNSLSDDDLALLHLISNSQSEDKEFVTSDGESALILPLPGFLHIIVRECSCVLDRDLPTLQERASLAQKLLTNFSTALFEGIQCGQSNLELSALRQINQIMLSLFRGEPDIANRTFDLILSALIIMLDAECSWLEFDDGSQKQRIAKGNAVLIGDILNSTQNAEEPEFVIVEIEGHAPNINGRLCVLNPNDLSRAKSLLPLMAQECSFVFEIEHLFYLLKNQISRLLGALNSAVVLVDERMRITYINKAAEDIFQGSAINIIGQPISFLPIFWSKHILNRLDIPASDAKALYEREAESLLLDWSILPIKDNNHVSGWLILADDRTDYYHWQEIGRKAESFSAIASIIGPLAHELRNPLAATKGLLQLIQRRKNLEKASGHIDLVLREIDRMNVLVNEFLQLGRSTKAHFEQVDLNSVLRELLPLISGTVPDNKVEIMKSLDPVPFVLADQSQLTQVILNIGRNAIEAVEPDGMVYINLKSIEKWVIMEFKDTGAGIQPEIMEKLFQPFVSTKDRGTGLGLAVSKAIIANHGGVISADNNPDRGAVFTIKLPIEQKKDNGPYIVDVLIAVADEMLCFPIEQVLHSAGLSTIMVQSHADALEINGQYQPLVVLLNDTVTLEIYNKIRRTWPMTKSLLVGKPINLTETSVPYMAKPINYAQLVETICSLIDQ